MTYSENPFLRHLEQCNTLLPNKRFPLFLNEQHSGWIAQNTASYLREQLPSTPDNGLNIPTPHILDLTEESLYKAGYFYSLHEEFDVSCNGFPPAFGQVDRGAIPLFAFVAKGVHLNGLVKKNNHLYLWVGRRAPHKKLDPNKLDHISAGGVPAGYTPLQAIIKEAAEEAGIAGNMTQHAQEKGRIVYALDRKEGLRRDILFCYDLFLPEDFRPQTVDGEVDSFVLLPLTEIYQLVRDTNDFKFNVNLAHIDLLLRYGFIDPRSKIGETLRQGLTNGLSPLSPGRPLQEGLQLWS